MWNPNERHTFLLGESLRKGSNICSMQEAIDVNLLEGATPSSVWVDVWNEAKLTRLQSWSRTSNAGSGC